MPLDGLGRMARGAARVLVLVLVLLVLLLLSPSDSSRAS
jgi:hypothetical protein